MIDSELRAAIHQYLIQKTDFLKVKDRLNDDQLRIFIDKAISDMCREERVQIPMEERIVVMRDLVNAVMSMGPLRSVMDDPEVTEVMVNGPNKVYIQKNGVTQLSDIKFPSEHHLLHTIQKLLSSSGTSKRVDESSPYVDFSLPDGARVNVILPPCSLVGPVMTIRKFSKDIATIDDLLNRQMLDKNMAILLTSAMKAKLNIVFCGATGTGKTTALNVLSRHIPAEERIITIEDTPELRLLQEHVVSLQSKGPNIEGKGEITIRDLFVNSLRMRPDRIIIGEVRSHEMLDLIQSISSGHSGSLAIVHADSPHDCFNRMVTMMMMAGIRLDTVEIRRQIARAIDLIVHIELFFDGVRRISYITDVEHDVEAGTVHLRDIFAFERKAVSEDGKVIGEWIMDRRRPSFYHKYERRHIELPAGFFED